MVLRLTLACKDKIMLYSSNMTHEEFYRVNGTLTPERIDSMFEKCDEAEAWQDLTPCIQEAHSCFIEEDFLQKEILKLQAFAKRLRGDNKAELLQLIEDMEGEITQAIASAEYGVSELNKCL